MVGRLIDGELGAGGGVVQVGRGGGGVASNDHSTSFDFYSKMAHAINRKHVQVRASSATLIGPVSHVSFCGTRPCRRYRFAAYQVGSHRFST